MKTVVVLSTLHKGAACQTDGKKKPEAVLYYNENKCGVDMLDSMCRQMSTKAGCRRWPLAVFWNILDIAGINAWILFRKTTNSQTSRRQFLRQLSAELTETSTSSGNVPAPASTSSSSTTTLLGKRVNCQVKAVCKRNRTTTLCDSCKRPVCGQCMVNICKQCPLSVRATMASYCIASIDACGCSRYTLTYRPHGVTKLVFSLIFHKRALN